MAATRFRWTVILSLGFMGMAVLGILALPAARHYWRWRESNPIRRGERLAGRMGCMNCHRPGATETKNPGSRLGTVPSFAGGNLMMYVDSEDQVEEIIRLGHRKGKDVPAGQLVIMPPYGKRVSTQEIADLKAFVVAANGSDAPTEGPEEKGYGLALAHGCFNCHGVAGAGGRPNPGSFKGYIPGWRGRDFADLVGDEKELSGWIRDGGIPRLKENAIARFFLRRQAVQMPAYDKALNSEEISALQAYVTWIRKQSPPFRN